MCIKAVDNYPSTVKYVPDQYRTQEMCTRAVSTCSFVFNSVPDRYKTKQMCHKSLKIILMQS